MRNVLLAATCLRLTIALAAVVGAWCVQRGDTWGAGMIFGFVAFLCLIGFSIDVSMRDVLGAYALRGAKAEQVLRELVDDVNSTDGLIQTYDYNEVPNAARDWPDLAATYVHACEVLNLTPKRFDATDTGPDDGRYYQHEGET